MGFFIYSLDAVLLSTGMATVRRYFNYNARDYVLQRISHPLANKVVGGYFSVGERIVDRYVEVFSKSKKD